MKKLLFVFAFLLTLGVADARTAGTCACNGLPDAHIATTTVPSGTYATAQSIPLACASPGTSPYFTTDGSIPTFPITGTTQLFTTNISVTTPTPGTFITVICAGSSSFNQSPRTIFHYIIETQAATPVLTPVTGTYPSVNATATCTPTPGCAMFYTLANPATTPNCSSTAYTGAVPVTVSGQTLSIISCASGFLPSNVTSATYTLSGGTPPACSSGATAGGLHLISSPTQPRTVGVSPLLVFFDVTATTDSDIIHPTATPFQDVTYTWAFSQFPTNTNPSENGTWAYGSNAGNNSKNTATGAIASHLYICPVGGGDCTYTATVTATDGLNTASCQIPVTAYDPAGSSGFAGANTTCYFNTTVGSGCPAGATQTLSSTAHVPAAGKQALYKCGDTFTGGLTYGTASKSGIGAYGSCPGTQTSRPIFTGQVTVGTTLIDGRIADVDFEGAGSYAVFENGLNGATSPGPLTLFNLNSTGRTAGYYIGWANQYGLIGSTMTNMGASVGNYLNYAGHQCASGSKLFNCGNGGTTWLQSNYVNNNYQAIIGSSLDGASPGAGFETLRVTACRLCVIANNSIGNAGGSSYAVFKFHGQNTFSTQETWIGEYTEFDEISDNYFYGTAGSQLTEVCPQNNVTDERLRNIVIERNLFSETSGGKGLQLSGVNITVRNNVFNANTGGSTWGVLAAKRGVEWTFTAGAPVDTNAPELIELYNNTCYKNSNCIGLTAGGNIAPANNSWAINTMMFGTGGTVINNSGSGNTISNNTTTVTNNPGWTNGTGVFRFISDFKPTTFFSGGIATQQPIFYDALGVPIAPTYDLGAVHP